MNNTYEECIQACLDCIKACNTCYDACLNEEDVKMMVPCIRMDRECTDICTFAVKSMETNSPFIQQICQACACGNECKQPNHEHCQTCAEACRKMVA